MRKSTLILPAAALAALAAAPAQAATGPFFSLHNTNFVVTIAFVLFLAILAYFKVPGLIAGLLDKRADTIRKELEEAATLREDAQALLAAYERKQKEVQAQADRIVESAKAEASSAAEAARKDLEVAIARRIAGAEEQIAAAEKAAVREVRDQAIAVSIAAAEKVIGAQMTPEQANALVNDSISKVQARLN